MCSNNTILNMMSISLNKPKAKLKKFCKYISVFEENIAKSPKSIAYKINGPICNLPKEIRSTILNKFIEILPTKYVLLDWIRINDLDWIWLSKNPNAIDLLKDNIKKIDWDALSLNPNAIELLEKYPVRIDWKFLSENPNAIDLLKINQKRINWNALSANPAIFKVV